MRLVSESELLCRVSHVQLKEGMYVWVKDPSIAGSDLYTKGHILNINANKVYSPFGPLTFDLGPGSGSGISRTWSHAQSQCAGAGSGCRSAVPCSPHALSDPSLVVRGW